MRFCRILSSNVGGVGGLMFSCQNYDAHSDVIVGVWQLDSHFEDGIDKKIGDCEKKTVWEFKDGEKIF